MCAPKEWACEQRDAPLANPTLQLSALENRLAEQLSQWSPPAPELADITVEGDEVYTRVGENLPPL